MNTTFVIVYLFSYFSWLYVSYNASYFVSVESHYLWDCILFYIQTQYFVIYLPKISLKFKYSLIVLDYFNYCFVLNIYIQSILIHFSAYTHLSIKINHKFICLILVFVYFHQDLCDVVTVVNND